MIEQTPNTVDGATPITPQGQLWKMLPTEYHRPVAQVLCHLKKSSQEDLCLALVAYIRFGIKRSFTGPFIKAIFEHLIYIINEC